MSRITLLQTIFLLSAPYVLYGADDTGNTRALLAAHQGDADEAIDDIFDQLYPPGISDSTHTAIAGIAGASGVSLTLLMARLLHQQPPTKVIDPISTSMGLEVLKALPAIGGSLVTAFFLYKGVRFIQTGFTAPIQREFDKLRQENSAFKDALKKHQTEYEAHVDALVERRLKAAETGIKALLSDWFQQIDKTNGQVMDSLTQQKLLLTTLRGKVSPVLYAEIDALIDQNAQSAQALESMHKISPATLEKYTKTHKGNAIKRFFADLFHRKNA